MRQNRTSITAAVFFAAAILAPSGPDFAGLVYAGEPDPNATPAAAVAKEPHAVQVVPYKQNGSVAGMQLRNVTPESGFGRAGFISGDVIKMLNGTPIKDPRQMQEIILTNETVKAVVLREDDTIEIKIPGRKAKKADYPVESRIDQQK